MCDEGGADIAPVDVVARVAVGARVFGLKLVPVKGPWYPVRARVALGEQPLAQA